MTKRALPFLVLLASATAAHAGGSKRKTDSEPAAPTSPAPAATPSPTAEAAVAAGPSALSLFLDLVANPDARRLAAFKLRCVGGGVAGGSIDFDGNPDANRALTRIQRGGALLPARGAVHAALHCADGASAERLHSWLGNELLVQQPRALVRALAAENAADRLADVVELENDTWFAVDCQGDARCERDRKALFAEKRKALQFAKPTKAEAIARQKLLDRLKSDL